ncbi:MAG: hypothetical protein KGP28_10300 [Bdellovibrionales bacterium]|nr:hypothetical protein [Bdellovibrionales bacterium]
MKLQTLALALAFSASSAFAHLELGTYQGATDSGGSCSFEVKGIAFEGGVKNPLNERVMIEYGNQARTLQHPPVVDVNALSATFQHEVLQSAIGTASGAEAFVLKMNSESHKPDSFVFIQDDWKNETRTAMTCNALVHGR